MAAFVGVPAIVNYGNKKYFLNESKFLNKKHLRNQETTAIDKFF